MHTAMVSTKSALQIRKIDVWVVAGCCRKKSLNGVQLEGSVHALAWIGRNV